jgi:hypothetical protein
MSEFFAVRNLDEKTKQEILQYAEEKDMAIAEAIRELVFLAKAHLSERPKKKFRSVFEVLDKIQFSGGDPHLSQNIDNALYGRKSR